MAEATRGITYVQACLLNDIKKLEGPTVQQLRDFMEQGAAYESFKATIGSYKQRVKRMKDYGYVVEGEGGGLWLTNAGEKALDHANSRRR